MNYVLIFIPTESLKIYGPFPTAEAAGKWGRKWDDENHQPFWQVIENPVIEFHPV